MSLGKGLVSIIMQGMVIYMNEQQLQTLEQLQAFLDGTVAIDLQLAPAERYGAGLEPVRRCAL
jgi:hypothetical protein